MVESVPLCPSDAPLMMRQGHPIPSHSHCPRQTNRRGRPKSQEGRPIARCRHPQRPTPCGDVLSWRRQDVVVRRSDGSPRSPHPPAPSMQWALFSAFCSLSSCLHLVVHQIFPCLPSDYLYCQPIVIFHESAAAANPPWAGQSDAEGWKIGP
jgi:hypothetical protein